MPDDLHPNVGAFGRTIDAPQRDHRGDADEDENDRGNQGPADLEERVSVYGPRSRSARALPEADDGNDQGTLDDHENGHGPPENPPEEGVDLARHIGLGKQG
jgi:hypothetical protein